MKCVVASLTLAFVLATSSSARAEEPEIADGIVVQVNGGIITRASYQMELNDLREELQLQMQGKSDGEIETEYERLKAGLLDRMIDDLLLEQRATDLGLNDDIEAEVNRQILQIMNESNIKSLDALEQVMRSQGILLDDVRSMRRKQLKRQAAVQVEVLQPMMSRGATPEQIEAALKQYLKKLRDDAFVKITRAPAELEPAGHLV